MKESSLGTLHLLRTCYSAPSCGIYMQLFPYRSGRDKQKKSKAKYGKELLLTLKKYEVLKTTKPKVSNSVLGILTNNFLNFLSKLKVFH